MNRDLFAVLSASALHSASIIAGVWTYERCCSKSSMLRKVDVHPVARSLSAIASIFIIYAVGWSNLLAEAAKSPTYIPVVAVSGFMFGFIGMMSWFGAGLRALRRRLEQYEARRSRRIESF